MSTTTAVGWRPVYDARETVAAFAARQRQAFAAFDVVWRAGQVSLKLKGYYDQLVRDVGTNAYAWWTEERWAEAFGVSVSTIKRVLRALTRAGLIRRERQFGTSSRTYLTVYDRVAADACATTATAALPVLQHDRPPEHGPEHGHHPEIGHCHTHGDDADHDGDHDDRDRALTHDPMLPLALGATQDQRQVDRQFFGSRPDPTIGSVLLPDHLKTRHLTVGAAGVLPPAAVTDPLTRQVLTHEGVADFILAPQLAQQAAGELQAVSQYLDTQASVRDRPRLFAWLATHGFGRQLLAGRSTRAPASARTGRPQRTPPAAVPSLPPPVPLLSAQTAIWTAVRTQIQTDRHTTELAGWLTDTVLLELTDDTAVIGTPNVFVRDAVAAHTTVLAAELAAGTGQDVDVTVVVDGWR